MDHTCTYYCTEHEHCVAMVVGTHMTEETLRQRYLTGTVDPRYGLVWTRIVRKPEGDMLEGPCAIGWGWHHDCYLFFGATKEEG